MNMRGEFVGPSLWLPIATQARNDEREEPDACGLRNLS
jgi:hypothetical protein